MAQQGIGRESVRGPARSGASGSPARWGSAAFLVPAFSHGLSSCCWWLPNVLTSLSRRPHPLSTWCPYRSRSGWSPGTPVAHKTFASGAPDTHPHTRLRW